MSKLIIMLLSVLFIVTICNDFSELIRCVNMLIIVLLAFVYFNTDKGKELVNKIYNDIIK